MKTVCKINHNFD